MKFYENLNSSNYKCDSCDNCDWDGSCDNECVEACDTSCDFASDICAADE